MPYTLRLTTLFLHSVSVIGYETRDGVFDGSKHPYRDYDLSEFLLVYACEPIVTSD
nr:MAG TPA: hypothetical protein [Microviridae sp.]